MKICCFGDTHYHGSGERLIELANEVREKCANTDVIVVVGDISGNGNLGFVSELLSAIKFVASAPVLVVPGNHDIYLSLEERGKGINSLLKLSLFNGVVERARCIPLMKKPFVSGNVGFVGTIGWYDYSFAPEWLSLNLEDFREKHYGMYVWADRDFVELPFSDEEFTLMLLNRFEEHIKEIYGSVEKIVAVMHHLPFRELVHYKFRPEWDYFSTFMGSEAFGHTIRKYRDKVKLVLHGHQHNEVETGVCKEVYGIKCCNCATPNPLLIEL